MCVSGTSLKFYWPQLRRNSALHDSKALSPGMFGFYFADRNLDFFLLNSLFLTVI